MGAVADVACRLVTFVVAVSLIVHPAYADRVIMKSGKVYEGHVLGETATSILISNPDNDAKPQFLFTRDILTVVHDTPAAASVSPSTRGPVLEALLTGSTFSSNAFDLQTTAGVHAGGGMRLHPLVEIDAEVNWMPVLSGSLNVSDGTTSRGYSRFYSLDGGFSGRLFPLYRFTRLRCDSYLTAGYLWNRLTPKASGDLFSGHSWMTGIGTSYPITNQWRWESRLVYLHTTYDTVDLLSHGGTLAHSIGTDGWRLSTGVARRFF